MHERKEFSRYYDVGTLVGVCTSLPLRDALARIPGWELAAGSVFRAEPRADGSRACPENPQPCDQAPDTHTHYIFRIALNGKVGGAVAYPGISDESFARAGIKREAPAAGGSPR